MSNRSKMILNLCKGRDCPVDEASSHYDTHTTSSSVVSPRQSNPGFIEVSPKKIMNTYDKMFQSVENIDREIEKLAVEDISERTYHTLENVSLIETVEPRRILEIETPNKACPCYMISTPTKHINNSWNNTESNNESIYLFPTSPIRDIDEKHPAEIVNRAESPDIENSPIGNEQVTLELAEENNALGESSAGRNSQGLPAPEDNNWLETPAIESSLGCGQVVFAILKDNENKEGAEEIYSHFTGMVLPVTKEDMRSKTPITDYNPNTENMQIEKEILPCREKSLLSLGQEPSVSVAYSESNGAQQMKMGQVKPKKKPDRILSNFGRIMEEGRSKVDAISNCRPWTKKNMCPYCMSEVTHFPRHLERNHSEEGAVAEALSLPSSNKKRKLLLDAIRRQGNYVRHNIEASIRPIRRPRDTQDNPDLEDGTYLPCDNCLGFFKRAYIRRHRSRCMLKDKNDNSLGRENHLSKIQLFTVCSGPYKDFYDSLQLKKEVFPIMRNDKVSKAAMSDVLICSYGESQLKKHKRTQIKNVISNKLREMGRLLLELKKTCGPKQLFDILKPEYFDNFVAATKVLSGFDMNEKTFRAGSLALHMGTNLKYICDAATRLIIKKSKLLPHENSEQRLKEVKRLKALIEQNWKTEISSIALKDLNEKNWQKPKLLPLTSDLMVFQKYVMGKANDAFKNIKVSQDIKKNYRILAECVLALTLLLNRKRIGEIQFLKTSVYSSQRNKEHNCDFLDTLTESEKILSKKFMRVVTGGKGSKPVAILFPSNIQNFITAMLNIRDKCVPQSNEYLFANPKTENRWLSGYHILKKLANESGVSNTELITSTRLRKQIASIIQVLNINDAEVEQLAKFMGHTKKTHDEYYRLPQDVYQTAKVSKILLAINKGQTAMYKGKSLDEIELSDNVVSEDSDEDSLSNDPPRKKKRSTAITNDSLSDSEDENYLPSNSAPPNLWKKQRDEKTGVIKSGAPEKVRRVYFTEDQKERICSFFKKHIEKSIPPRKHEVEQFIEENKKLFNNKNWIKIKAFVFNSYKHK